MTLFQQRLLGYVIATAMVLPAAVYAQTGSIQTGLEGAARGTGLVNVCNASPDACLVDVVGRLINIVLGLTGIALFGYLLYGGIRWMTAGGEKEKVEKSTSTLRNAVAGMIIIALAYSVSVFVLSQLTIVVNGGVSSAATSSTP